MVRCATVTIGSYWAKKLNVLEGTNPCHVLGIFQGMDNDWAGPIAVCELNDGRIVEIPSENVRFVDTLNGVILEDGKRSTGLVQGSPSS